MKNELQFHKEIPPFNTWPICNKVNDGLIHYKMLTSLLH